MLTPWMNKAVVCAVAIGAIVATSSQVDARRRARRSRVPAAAISAARQRAGIDLGTSNVKVYNSRHSKKLSRGLKSNLGGFGKAYVVHAKALNHSTGRTGTPKSRGSYLVAKSEQGIWEAFPVALASQKRRARPSKSRMTKVNAKRPENNTYAFADGLIPGSKVVQAVTAKNTYWTSTSQGQIVASKGRGKTKTLFILGDPNRQGSDPAAMSTIRLINRKLMPYHRGGPIGMPNPTAISSQLNTKFLTLPQPVIAPISPRQPIQR